MGCSDSGLPPRHIDTPAIYWMESMKAPCLQMNKTRASEIYFRGFRIHYSGSKERICTSQKSDLSISRSRQENILSSDPDLKISTPKIAYDTSFFPTQIAEGSWNVSKNVGVLPSYADRFSSELTSADECASELNIWEILSTEATIGERFGTEATSDLELDNLPPIETISALEDSSQSCISKVLQVRKYGVVEGEFSDSEGTVVENEEVNSSADSYGQFTPVSGETSERFGQWPGKLRSKLPQAETHDFGKETTQRKSREDILEFAKQEVNRTQNVASILSEKLESMTPLLQILRTQEKAGSQSPTFSVLSLQKCDNIEITTSSIDDLDAKINETSKSIQFLRARSVSTLTDDQSADDFLTSSYQEVEREIFSLQDHRLELEKQKDKLLGDLQLQLFQSSESPPTYNKGEFTNTVVREVCTSNAVLPEEC